MLDNILIRSSHTVVTNRFTMYLLLVLGICLCLLHLVLERLFLTQIAIVNACRDRGLQFTFLIASLTHLLFSFDLTVYGLKHNRLLPCLVQLAALTTP